MRKIAKERGFRGNIDMFGWGLDMTTDIAHINASEGLIYSVDNLLDRVKIKYATPEALQKQIDKLSSELRFMQDSGADSWNIRRIQNKRNSFISYQEQLQGKPAIEPSLEELDRQKQMLEA